MIGLQISTTIRDLDNQALDISWLDAINSARVWLAGKSRNLQLKGSMMLSDKSACLITEKGS